MPQQLLEDEYEDIDNDEYEDVPESFYKKLERKGGESGKRYKKQGVIENLLDTAPAKGIRAVGRGVMDLATIPAMLAWPGEKAGEAIVEGMGFKPGGETSLGKLDKLRKDYLRPEEEEEMIPGVVQRLTRSGPFGPLGIAGDLLGLGAKETVKAGGGSEGWQTAADIGTNLATGIGGAIKGFMNAPKAAPKNQVTQLFQKNTGPMTKPAMQAANPTNPKNAQTAMNLGQRNIESLPDATVKQYGKLVDKLGKDTLGDPATFSAREIAKDIENGNQRQVLNMLSPVEDEARAWSSVQEAVETGFRKEKESYTKLYNGVRAKVGHIETRPLRSRSALQQIKERINSVKTMPPAYQATGKALESIEHDLGLITAKLDNFTMSMDDSTTIAQLQDLAIRVGDLINYDTIVPTVKNWLKPLQKAIKDDIRTAMKESGNKGALQAWNKAEQAYGHAAERYGADAVKTLRKTETPEAMTALFSTPSNVQKLRGVASGDVLSLAERHIIEKMMEGSTNKATGDLRQMARHLSDRGKYVADQLLDMGDKLSSRGHKALTQNMVLQDVQDAIGKGARPEATLKLMKTPEGYKIAKKTLEKTAKGKGLFKDLERTFMADFSEAVIGPNGNINIEKAKEFLKDPEFRKVFEQIVGKDGVNFLNDLDRLVPKLQANIERFASMPKAATGKEARGTHLLETLRPEKTWLSDLNKFFDPKMKLLLTMFGFPIIGKVAVGAYVADRTSRMLYRVLTRPKIQRGIRNMAAASKVPAMQSAMRLVLDDIESVDKDND